MLTLCLTVVWSWTFSLIFLSLGFLMGKVRIKLLLHNVTVRINWISPIWYFYPNIHYLLKPEAGSLSRLLPLSHKPHPYHSPWHSLLSNLRTTLAPPLPHFLFCSQSDLSKTQLWICPFPFHMYLCFFLFSLRTFPKTCYSCISSCDLFWSLRCKWKCHL